MHSNNTLIASYVINQEKKIDMKDVSQVFLTDKSPEKKQGCQTRAGGRES